MNWLIINDMMAPTQPYQGEVITNVNQRTNKMADYILLSLRNYDKIVFSINVVSAALVVNSIDYDADPCEDFDQFSCGMWKRKHVIPEDESVLFSFSLLENEENVIIKCKCKEEYMYAINSMW
jgi:hypothetical protein